MLHRSIELSENPLTPSYALRARSALPVLFPNSLQVNFINPYG